jgi:hypothetical protein
VLIYPPNFSNASMLALKSSQTHNMLLCIEKTINREINTQYASENDMLFNSYRWLTIKTSTSSSLLYKTFFSLPIVKIKWNIEILIGKSTLCGTCILYFELIRLSIYWIFYQNLHYWLIRHQGHVCMVEGHVVFFYF